jgi:hypothetical protein
VVHLEGAFVPVGRQGAAAEGGARVVHQDVDPRQPGQLRGQRPHVVQPGEVRGQPPRPGQPCNDGGGLLRRPADDHQLGAAAVQPAGRRRTDAVAAAGDDDDGRAQLFRSTTNTGISRSVLAW